MHRDDHTGGVQPAALSRIVEDWIPLSRQVESPKFVLENWQKNIQTVCILLR